MNDDSQADVTTDPLQAEPSKPPASLEESPASEPSSSTPPSSTPPATRAADGQDTAVSGASDPTTANAEPTPAVPRLGFPSRLTEWFWRGRTLRTAREAWATVTPERQRALLQARSSVFAAVDLLDPVDPLPRGADGTYPAWVLVRHAGEALADHTAGSSEPSDEGGGAENEPPADPAELLAQTRRRIANLRAQTEAELAPVEAIRKLIRQRGRRMFGATFGVVVLSTLVSSVSLGRFRSPHLPATERTSSSMGLCHPERNECLGASTSIRFHTNEENNPWAEYDLGAVRPISEVLVRNRSDFGSERAVPLVVEVSDDRNKWREVAKREKDFDTWKASVKGTSTRYVRVRVTRRTILHLEGVEIR